ncbi:MAG: M13 family metallopeptidase, partial [Pseudomonadota bacterium]
FSARGLRETTPIHVRITERMDEIIAVFNETPLQVWKDYLSLRLILDYGSYLDESTALLIHRFDMARLGAEYAPRKRRERAWRVALDLLPDPIGQAYIDEHLSDQTIAEVQKMVGWTLAAYRERIEVAEWLTDETRARAIEKLNAINVVVGEPPGWNNFDGYTPVRGSLFSNAYTRQQLRHQSALSRLRVPEADRAEEPPDPTRLLTDIFFSPLGVGAYYLPTLNTIVIPAAYLQRPYYDPSASVAVNFGALGTTLGHELGHAFDDQGAKRGPHGQLQNWWQDGDSERYRALGANLSAHLSAFEAAPGIPLNTQLTLGENLSDLAGIEIAWRALELAKSASGETSISDEEARAFFISYAQKRRAKRLPTVNINFAYSDPHSPPAVRVNGILPHIDSWYEAFDITENDPLWLAPEDRIRIW